MKYKAFRMPLYMTKIHVCTLDFPTEKLKIDPKSICHDTNMALGDCQECKNKDTGSEAVLIRLPNQYKADHVWHESMHAAAFVLKIMGIPFDADNMDVLIYPTEVIHGLIKQRFYKLPVDFLS